MSYPSDISTDTLRSLIARRELYGYRAGPHQMKPRIEQAPPIGHLELSSYQKFVENLFSPYTEYRSIHLMWSTGAGKTIGALMPAMRFIRVYRPLFVTAVASRGTAKISRAAVSSADASTPSVFVLGFANTRAAFVRDLLGYTYFGFITETEREELQNLQRNAASQSEADIKRYTEYYSMLRRRITDKTKGGFFKFLGYNEFVNRLFYSEKTTLEAIEAEARTRARADPDVTLESVVQEYIDKGIVSVNEDLIAMLQNSLLICDEIPETYNTMTKNSRGVAIQYVLDRVPSLRLITMSATPINNSPMESVDFVNYHVKDKIRKSDVFKSETEFKPGGKELLGRAMFGKLSFVQDTDRRFFPSREIEGEPFVVPPHHTNVWGFTAGEILPYLKFVKCDMSPLQKQVHDAYFGAAAQHDRPVPTDGRAILDMVFPSPEPPTTESAAEAMFRTAKTKESIRSAPDQWRQEEGVEIKQVQNTTVIAGRYMHIDNIGKYSAKYKRVIEDTIAAFRDNGPHKMLIYHNFVEMSGVVAIHEMLKENGILDEQTPPSANTLCVYCAQTMLDHIGATDDDAARIRDHEFVPIRSIVVHSNNEETVNRAALARFDDPSNTTGLNYAILIGSKLIRQGFDFKALQRIALLSVPSSIYNLIQILGRGDRKNSHALLPPEKRHVKVQIYVTTDGDKLTPEIMRYAKKLRYHLISQEIVQEWQTNAIDADVNYNINMSADKLQKYFPGGDTSAPPQRVMEALYYEPRIRIGVIAPLELSSVTHYAHGHFAGAIRAIVLLVKYAFTLRPAWTRDDLFKFVQNPPVAVQYDPALLMQQQFDAAMRYLLQQQRTVINRSVANESSSIYNFTSKFVQIGRTRHSIAAVGDYYVAIPAMSNVVRDKVITGEPIIDAETYMRVPDTRRGITFNLATLGLHTEAIVQKTRQRIAALKDVRGFLTVVSTAQQIEVVQNIIMSRIDSAVGMGGNDKFPFENEIMTLLQDLGALVTAKQVRTYRDVDSIVGVVSGNDGDFVGYSGPKTIQIYNKGVWHTVKKAAMNRKVDYRENTKIVGVLETSGETTKLKLRRNVEEIKSDLHARTARSEKKSHSSGADVRRAADTRTIERGMVCETQSRDRLFAIMKKLGIRPQGRTKDYCEAILHKLIELEIAERKAKTKVKYLYGWWNTPLKISS